MFAPLKAAAQLPRSTWVVNLRDPSVEIRAPPTTF
jgi:hypothetical protein